MTATPTTNANVSATSSLAPIIAENAVSLFLPSHAALLCPVLFSPVLGLSVSLPPVAMYALLRPQLNAAAQREAGKEEKGRRRRRGEVGRALPKPAI